MPRLSVDAVRELAESSGADGDAIHELTGGNPFYVTEVLAVGSDVLPETVRDAVLARVAPLGADARPFLEVVALVPGGAELWLLEVVAPEATEHLDACLAAGVLSEDALTVGFRHELARLVLEDSVPAVRKRRLHAALLVSLEAGGAGASRLAHHAEHAGDAAAVMEHAPAAAREASAAKAHREAAQQYARALRFASDHDARARAELLGAYALELQLTGLSAAAAAAWREAASLYRSLGDRLGEGVCLAWLIRACVPIGRNAEAEEASRAAIELLESVGPSPELARAYAAQAYMRMLNRDNADGVAWGTRAAKLAEQLDDTDTLAYALNMIGTSHVMAGEIDTGVDRLLESLRIARENGLWLWVGPALSMLGSGLGEMYELPRSEQYLREHLAWADEHDLWPYYSLSWLALVQAYTGRWAEATATASDVLSKADDAISRISALVALGRIRARRGDPGRDRGARRGPRALAAGRAPAAARARACRPGGGDVAHRRRRTGGLGGAGRLRPRAREASPLVHRRARVLAAPDGHARPLARLGGGAVEAPARGVLRGSGERLACARLPLRGGSRARGAR